MSFPLTLNRADRNIVCLKNNHIEYKKLFVIAVVKSYNEKYVKQLQSGDCLIFSNTTPVHAFSAQLRCCFFVLRNSHI